MHYEINVSKNGAHYFATAERSITTSKKAKEVYDQLRAAFLEESGYSITISRWQTVGEQLDPKKLGGPDF